MAGQKSCLKIEVGSIYIYIGQLFYILRTGEIFNFNLFWIFIYGWKLNEKWISRAGGCVCACVESGETGETWRGNGVVKLIYELNRTSARQQNGGYR